MPSDVVMPKLGLTMQEGTIDEWLVEPGTVVTSGDVLMRLATDKVDVDVEAEGDGRFYPAAAAGTALPPGAVIGWLLADGEQPPAGVSLDHGPSALPQVSDAAAGAPAGGRSPARPRSSPYARRRARELRIDLAGVAGSGPAGRIIARDVEALAGAGASGQPVTAPGPANAASPLVRRLARSLDVDLADVPATGPGGRIRRADVDELMRARVPGESGDVASTVGLTGMRGAIARAMHASLHEMAQLTEGREIDVTRLVRVRNELKAEADDGLVVPTVTDFVVRAAAMALRDHPMLNATVRGDEICVYREIRIGLAVAVPGGLVVPAIMDAGRGSLLLLARETRRLADAAREGRLSAQEVTGPTFAVSSLGSYGVDFFTPIINPGNSGILGVGRIRDGVRWEDDTPRRTSVMTLSLTFDHRVVDGADAAKYLLAVEHLLDRPTLLLVGQE
jgi:pyruvate/2-oxoglutarate dehydrogenase complex dihydrolipoamide acyltransferase (E2) component